MLPRARWKGVSSFDARAAVSGVARRRAPWFVPPLCAVCAVPLPIERLQPLRGILTTTHHPPPAAAPRDASYPIAPRWSRAEGRVRSNSNSSVTGGGGGGGGGGSVSGSDREREPAASSGGGGGEPREPPPPRERGAGGQ